MKRSPLACALFALVYAFPLPTFAAEAAEKSEPAAAATSKSPGEQLVITKGVFSRNGENVPATVRNLIDLVLQRYPDATITLVGVDDIVIENLTLTLRRVRIFDDPKAAKPQPVLSVLTAFSQASGLKFLVQGFSENDFLLSAVSNPSRRQTEVFNLGLLTGAIQTNKPAIEEEIRALEAEATVLSKQYGDQHPRMIEIRSRIEIFKARLQSPATKSNTSFIETIKDAVISSLPNRSDQPPPEFRYHPGTNLLIVTGSEEAIELTRKVVAALEKTPKTQRIY